MGVSAPSKAMQFCCVVAVVTTLIYCAQAQKPGNVACGKSTTVPINGGPYKVGAGESYSIQSRKMTRRCVVTYQVGEGCNDIRIRCPKFYLPNNDCDKCR